MNTDWVKDYILKSYNYTEENILQNSVEDYYNIKNQYLQMPLFRYNSFNSNNLSNLKNEVFYLQNPFNFNDPFDCNLGFGTKYIKQHILANLIKDLNLPVVASVKEIEREYSKKHGIQVNLEEEINSCNIQEEIKKMLSEHIGISCLSEDNKSVLMWSHYAGKHTGFCVEYDFSINSFDKSYDDISSRLQIFPVIYSNNRPNMSYLYNIDFIKQIKTDESASGYLRAMLEYNLLFKAQDWSYEKEWRVLGRNSENQFCPSPHPKSVYLGINVSEENKQKIVKIAKSKGIPVYQMKLSDSKYAFDEPELVK